LRGTALNEDTLRKLLMNLNDGIQHRTHKRSLWVDELRTILAESREDGAIKEFSNSMDFEDDVATFGPDDHEDVLQAGPPTHI
jgi:hypothetical protein